MNDDLRDLAAEFRDAYFTESLGLSARNAFDDLPPIDQARWLRVAESAAWHTDRARADAWAEGYQDACDDTPSPHAPSGPTDERNPYADGGAA